MTARWAGSEHTHRTSIPNSPALVVKFGPVLFIVFHPVASLNTFSGATIHKEGPSFLVTAPRKTQQ